MIRRRQRGVALLAMLALIAMGAAWFTVRQLSAMSSDYTIANRTQNAAVLARAKAALIGHIAMQAAKAGETDPGRLPCPEAAGNVGGSLEGATSGTCTFPAIGRFPWRTVGTEKFLDASGEPLWYVVASGWALGANLVINPNCTSDATMACFTGQLTVDGTKDTVALIIAPGPAMNVVASAGCAARNQARATPSPAIDPLDYIECYNAATSSFVTKGSSSSFNDQVVKITAAELLPVIEAAIADRIAHELAPLWKSAYSGGLWAATPVLSFAAPFSNPTTGSFKGSAGTLQGLPPLNYAFTASPGSASACTPTPCTPAPCILGSNPRCDPGFVTWQGATITQTAGALLGSYSCSVAGTPSVLTCTIYTYDFLNSNASMTFNFSPRANNAGMALRQINATVPITGLDTTFNPPYGYTTIAGASTINADGSATVALSAQVPSGSGSLLGITPLCGFLSTLFGLTCYQRTVTVPMALLSDHQLVDPGNSNPAGGFTDHSWFFRAKWHEVSYYAVAAGIAPSGARSCTTAVNCLVVNYHPSVGKQRGILVLGGTKIGTQNRPAVAVTDLLEGANADGDSIFTLHGAPLPAPPLLTNKTFNDHIAVIDSN